uniref:Pectate lyase superfamily protein domain-containing protein n=1 Tax=uncultured bacterium contig00097 TaxID=1181566 RepID=A0A806KNE0_9BACT|nr:hypothetical protein [uncultured bacterium contig00097]
MKHTILLATIITLAVASLNCDRPQTSNVPPPAAKDAGYISYSQYGAVGDGKTDDLDAIIKAHAAANESGLPVKADAGANYYIGNTIKTAIIQTDTDWDDAKFIIDDSEVDLDGRNSHVFSVTSKLPPTQITTVASFKMNQGKLDLSLPHNSFIEATDANTLRYIRFGPNQNNGAPQIDVFVVDKTGNVDMRAPIIWDFDNVSTMTAYPIDPETLTIKGGHFTTIANRAEPRYTSYSRGIDITRSNVLVDNVYHAIAEEGDQGAPYRGFISIGRCADVTVQNSTLSGHKVYSTLYSSGAAGSPVWMGTYDVNVNRAINVKFINCKQANDVNDPTLWGIFTSNFSKNLLFDRVEFSRFDAHQGVTNAVIKDSVVGFRGINLIGRGQFLVENTKVFGPYFIDLRSDYGSTFEGEVIIRNCEFTPNAGRRSDAILFGGNNTGQHNFGYTCHMPKKITIDGLAIHDVNPPSDYQGPKIFADFNKDFTSEDYKEQFPFVITEEVAISNMTTKSGKPFIVSKNPFMFRKVKITEK